MYESSNQERPVTRHLLPGHVPGKHSRIPPSDYATTDVPKKKNMGTMFQPRNLLKPMLRRLSQALGASVHVQRMDRV